MPCNKRPRQSQWFRSKCVFLTHACVWMAESASGWGGVRSASQLSSRDPDGRGEQTRGAEGPVCPVSETSVHNCPWSTVHSWTRSQAVTQGQERWKNCEQTMPSAIGLAKGLRSLWLFPLFSFSTLMNLFSLWGILFQYLYLFSCIPICVFFLHSAMFSSTMPFIYLFFN